MVFQRLLNFTFADLLSSINLITRIVFFFNPYVAVGIYVIESISLYEMSSTESDRDTGSVKKWAFHYYRNAQQQYSIMMLFNVAEN